MWSWLYCIFNLIRYIRSNTYVCFIFISYVSLFIYIGDTSLRDVSPHSRSFVSLLLRGEVSFRSLRKPSACLLAQWSLVVKTRERNLHYCKFLIIVQAPRLIFNIVLNVTSCFSSRIIKNWLILLNILIVSIYFFERSLVKTLSKINQNHEHSQLPPLVYIPNSLIGVGG